MLSALDGAALVAADVFGDSFDFAGDLVGALRNFASPRISQIAAGSRMTRMKTADPA